MRHREPLFSVHATGDGEFAIYLEERDANLDLLEDVTDQVNLIDLAGLKEFASVDALKHLDAASRLDKVRAGMPNVICKIAKLTEAEALTLAEQLIMIVKEYRAINKKPAKLELVK
jgi:hypothetical protein